MNKSLAILCACLPALSTAQKIDVQFRGADFGDGTWCPSNFPVGVTEKYSLASNQNPAEFIIARTIQGAVAPELARANVGTQFHSYIGRPGWNYYLCVAAGYQTAHTVRFLHLPTGVQSDVIQVAYTTKVTTAPAPAPAPSPAPAPAPAAAASPQPRPTATTDRELRLLIRCSSIALMVGQANDSPEFTRQGTNVLERVRKRSAELTISDAQVKELLKKQFAENQEYSNDPKFGQSFVAEELDICFRSGYLLDGKK